MRNSKRTLMIKILTAFAYLIMVTVNALANIIPIGGVGTGEVSDAYPNLFAPAGVTFSIWGIIYILLAAFTLFQIGLFNKERNEDKQKLVLRISTFFMLSSFVNAAWIFAWHYKVIWVSLILMIILFILLMLITIELKKANLSKKEEIFMRLPFSVYFGWITIALIANIVAFLVSVSWGGFGLTDAFWTVLLLIAGAAIGTTAILCNRDFFYGLVLIWAYAGVMIKHLSSNGFDGSYMSVVIAAGVGIALFIASDTYMLFAQKEPK